MSFNHGEKDVKHFFKTASFTSEKYFVKRKKKIRWHRRVWHHMVRAQHCTCEYLGENDSWHGLKFPNIFSQSDPVKQVAGTTSFFEGLNKTAYERFWGRYKTVVQLCSPITLLVLIRLISNKATGYLCVSAFCRKKFEIYLQIKNSTLFQVYKLCWDAYFLIHCKVHC